MSFKPSSIIPVLAVDDLDRATTFYRDKLGLTVRQSDEFPGGAVVEVGSSYLFIYKTDFKRGENTLASIAVEDVDATVRELRERGVAFEEYDLPDLKTENGVVSMGDYKNAWFKDSEGNTISIGNDLSEALSRAA